MTRLILLDHLKEFTETALGDILLPVMPQREDGAPPPDRRTAVYRMRLVKSSAAKRAAPYIIHQIITGKDIQPAGERESAAASVRSIFCVYNDNEEEGALSLLNLMERLRIALLRQVVIGEQFQLDLEAGLELLVYPDETAPFYAGEMMSTWKLPAVEREVRQCL